MQKKISLKEIANSISETAKILGKSDRMVTAVAPINEASIDSVAFCNRKGEQGLQMIRNSRAGGIICHDDLQLTADDFKDKTLILVPNPRSVFIQVMKEHFLNEKTTWGIAATAIVDKEAEIHPNVYIGHHCYIGKCKIGEGTIIFGNNYIYSNTQIGRNVVIHAGAVIGAEASGFARDAKGELEKFPQIGGVIIEDDVQIGSNTIITRGAMENTIIGQRTKIANLCYVGHGAIIGRHCLILNHSAVGGYSQIGDYARISIGATVRDTIQVGSKAFVGMGAVVTKNIGDNKIAFGVPAKEQGETPQ